METNSKLKNAQTDRLFEAVLQLENVEECYAFFEDLCTISELQAMSQRMEVVTLLREGITYQEIVKKTGASTATISRVNRCLNYGAGGYRQVLEKLEKKEK